MRCSAPPGMSMTAKVWTIPAERMKGGREHHVPLSVPTLALLRQMRGRQDHDLVFPGLRGQLSPKTMQLALRRMGRGGLTVHGFRSSFRDWAAEQTTFPAEAGEMALAHLRTRSRPPTGARPVRQAPQADGGMGRVLRQGRDGHGQGGRARSCATTAIASRKARGRPASRRIASPSRCLLRATSSGDGDDGVPCPASRLARLDYSIGFRTMPIRRRFSIGLIAVPIRWCF